MRSALVLATLLAAAAWSPAASAKCASSALRVWPEQGTLPVNGQIVLTGYAGSQELIRTIAKKHPRLTRKGEQIELRAEQIHEGEYHLTQVVLTPEKRLTEGQTYRLAIDGVSGHELSAEQKGEYAPIQFRATAEDTEAPAWNDAPALLGTESIAFGCGPSSEAKVKVSVSEPVMLLVELQDLATETTRRFLLEPQDGLLRLGHGMCSGAFQLEPKRAHRARLIAVDAAGRSTPAPGAALEFLGPVLGDQ